MSDQLYVKLFSKILDSSIWLESPTTRVVWITLLASMDCDGFCQFASINNLATRAQVKLYRTKEAVAILEAPDTRSSDDGYEGRRIERSQGGWYVLNAKKYRTISRSGDMRKARRILPQLAPTCPNLPQLAPTQDVSTNEINKSLPEVEVEEKKIQTTPSRFTLEAAPDGDINFQRLCEVHPKPERGHTTQIAYLQAVEWVVRKEGKTRQEAMDYIHDRAQTYARLCRFRTGLYKWLEEKIFAQKDSAWSDIVSKTSLPMKNAGDEFRRQLESD